MTFGVADNVWWSCTTGDRVCAGCTLPAGVVEFQLVQAGNLVVSVQRHIGDFVLQTIRVENESDEPFCEVNLSDAQAQTWGPNQLGLVLFPGQFVDLRWPGSRIDVRAVGCDGNQVEALTVDLFSTVTVGLG